MSSLTMRYLSDFFKELETIRKEFYNSNDLPLWFRGHSVCAWQLIPGIYRYYIDLIKDDTDGDVIDFTYFKKTEKNMFVKFADSYIFKKENEKSLWRTYYYMQHYNVETRLLDWSENPLIALFFAVIENPDKDGAVWILDPYSLNSDTISNLIKCRVNFGLPIFNQEDPVKDIFYNKETKLLNYDALAYKYYNLDFENEEKATPLALAPIRLDNRMEMQQSCFTIFGNKINGLVKNNYDGKFLAKKIITKKSKEFLKNELLRSGITFSKIYPDLDGLGKEINLEYYATLAITEKFTYVLKKK